MMNNVFFDLLDAGVVCYLDDLLLYSKSVAEHQALLTKVFAILSKNKLYLKDSKCHLFLEKVNFLGHVVSADGVAMEAGKVQAVQDWPVPTSMNQVQ
jgi:hypothetical protein